MGLQIYGNIDAGSLLDGKVQSANNLSASGIKDLVAGDGLEVELFLTSQSGLVNIQDYSVRLGIGDLNARPTGGTWDLGSSTSIVYNVSQSALQGVISAEVGANTTTQLSPFVFKTVFTANGSQTIPAIDSTGLTPNSTVSIVKLVTGDGSTQEQWLTRIFRNPIAFQDTWTNFTKTDVGEGISGALGLGTAEIYDQFSDTVSSFSSTMELEITDTDGNVSTIFQIPVTIGGEVLGAGITASSISPSNFVTATDVNTTVDSATTRANSINISASRGNDATGTRNSTTKPYATLAGGIADAQSGDTIVILDGDFSSESVPTINVGIITLDIKPKVKTCGLTFGGSVTNANIFGSQDCSIDGALTINSSCLVRGITLNNIITNGFGNLYFQNCDFRGGTSVDTISITTLSPVAGQITFEECIIRKGGSTNTVLQNENVAVLYFKNTYIEEGTGANTIQLNNSSANSAGVYFQNSLIQAASSFESLAISTTGGFTPPVYFVGGLTQFERFTSESDFSTFSGNYYISTQFPPLNVNLAP